MWSSWRDPHRTLPQIKQTQRLSVAWHSYALEGIEGKQGKSVTKIRQQYSSTTGMVERLGRSSRRKMSVLPTDQPATRTPASQPLQRQHASPYHPTPTPPYPYLTRGRLASVVVVKAANRARAVLPLHEALDVEAVVAHRRQHPRLHALHADHARRRVVLPPRHLRNRGSSSSLLRR